MKTRFSSVRKNALGRDFVPEVLQSGFGVRFLFWSGEFEENCQQILSQILSNVASDFLLTGEIKRFRKQTTFFVSGDPFSAKTPFEMKP